MISLLTRWPTLSFLLSGLICFLAYQSLFPQRPQIIITAQQFAWTLAEWQRQHHAVPTSKQRQLLVEKTIEEQLLYQEALARGLQFSSAVEARLVKLHSYLQNGNQTQEDDGYIPATQSRDLKHYDSENSGSRNIDSRTIDSQNFIATDPLIRRYLISTLKQQLLQNTAVAAIPEQQLKLYYANHQTDFTTPARVSFYHLFFSGFEQTTVTRARSVLAQLQQQIAAPQEAVKRGDVFYGGHYLPANSQAHIQSQLGGEMGKRVLELPLKQWSEPIRSAYGWHLVYVNKRLPAEVTPFAQVRDKIASQLTEQARLQALPQALASLRERYVITVAINAS